jgi:hypothetical protein
MSSNWCELKIELLWATNDLLFYLILLQNQKSNRWREISLVISFSFLLKIMEYTLWRISGRFSLDSLLWPTDVSTSSLFANYKVVVILKGYLFWNSFLSLGNLHSVIHLANICWSINTVIRDNYWIINKTYK